MPMRRRRLPFVAALLGALISMPSLLGGEVAALWGSLEPGDHAVGFRVLETYDQTRSFLDKRDYDGTLRSEERTRPVQIALWYPAQKGGGKTLRYEDYLALRARETSFDGEGDVSREEILRAFAAQARMVGIDEEGALELVEVPCAARRAAPPAPGRFPLVLYAPGFNGSSSQVAVLGEYLASHGYVVASSPSMGPRSRRMIGGPLGLETQTRDLEHLLATLRGKPFVDRDRVAAIGFSFGGGAVTLLEMRNQEIDAVVVYDGIEAFRDHPALDLLERSGWFEPRNMTAPRLRMHVGHRDETDLSLYDAMIYSERFVVDLPHLEHGHFSTAAMTSDWVQRRGLSSVSEARLGHELICRMTRAFLDWSLLDDEEAYSLVRRGPKRTEYPAGFVRVHHDEALPAPPSEASFVRLVEVEGVEAARRLMRKLRKANPDLVPFNENTMNVLGYSLLWSDRIDEAIGVLELNAEAYPDSWNVHDSLGEAYAAAGQREKAIQSYRRSLKLEPRNENARTWLEKLESAR